MKLVSVVVSVYNIERYIENCITQVHPFRHPPAVC